MLRPGLQKGGWTPKEDDILKEMVMKEGAMNVKWATVAATVSFFPLLLPFLLFLYFYCRLSCLEGSESSAEKDGSTTSIRPSKRPTGRTAKTSFFSKANASSETGFFFFQLPSFTSFYPLFYFFRLLTSFFRPPLPLLLYTYSFIRWSEIAKMLPGRAENTVKNRWNSSTYKRWLNDHSYSPGPESSQYDLGTTAGSLAAFQHLVQVRDPFLFISSFVLS